MSVFYLSEVKNCISDTDVLEVMPVIIFIIPLPSAEMSLSRYSLRSKYIISLKIFVSRHIFLQQKYTFYSTSPSFIVIYTEYLRYLNKERAEKQLLTVNSVNHSCSSALNHSKILSIISNKKSPISILYY